MADRVQWPKAYARLEQTSRTLGAGQERPPEEVTRVLRARAQALARPLEETATLTEMLELLVFSLAGERYGIETAYVLEVVPLREQMPVPCTPPFVLGVVNYRGRILPVLDFRPLLDLAEQGVAEASRVVAVETGEMTFGILADAVSGVERIGAHEVAPPPMAPTGGRQTLIKGVTREMIAVFDLQALAREPRIVVNDEVVR